MTDGKTGKRRLLILLGTVLLAAAAFLVVVSMIELEREQIDCDTEILDLSIEDFSMNFAVLDRYIRAQFPEKCSGLYFVDAQADITFENGSVKSGTMKLCYFRYIDESKEGGNIEAVEFFIDPVAGTVQNSVHYQGSGRSYQTSGETISGNISAIPLEDYMQNLTSLTGVQSSEAVRMLADCGSSFMDVSFFIEEGQEAVYSERVTGWDEDAGFASRITEPLNERRGAFADDGGRWNL